MRLLTSSWKEMDTVLILWKQCWTSIFMTKSYVTIGVHEVRAISLYMLGVASISRPFISLLGSCHRWSMKSAPATYVFPAVVLLHGDHLAAACQPFCSPQTISDVLTTLLTGGVCSSGCRKLQPFTSISCSAININDWKWVSTSPRVMTGNVGIRDDCA